MVDQVVVANDPAANLLSRPDKDTLGVTIHRGYVCVRICLGVCLNCLCAKRVFGKAVLNVLSGNKSSIKYRTVAALEKYISNITNGNQGNISDDYVMQVKLAINDIYNNPMQENCKYLLNRMLKTSTLDEIVEAILEMRKSGNLCKIPEGINALRKQASIICSMGLSKI